jgi:hypothetical protein
MDFDTKPDNFTRDDNDDNTSRNEANAATGNANSDGRPASISFNNNPEKPANPDQEKQQRHRRFRKLLFWTLGVLAVVMLTAFWLRYFNPYGVGKQECGYVIDFECRGYVFKTWEGQMVVKNALNDSTHQYMRNFDFSVDDSDVADEILRYKNMGKEVIVTYKRYLGTLLWRGEHQYIVTGVEPVEPIVAPAADADSTATDAYTGATAQTTDND